MVLREATTCTSKTVGVGRERRSRLFRGPSGGFRFGKRHRDKRCRDGTVLGKRKGWKKSLQFVSTSLRKCGRLRTVLMLRHLNNISRGLLVVAAVAWAASGCGPDVPAIITESSSSSSSSSSSGDLGPCGRDCSEIDVPPCRMSVCNTGEYLGTLYECIVVPSPKGTSCDDGKYCTIGDVCEDGFCVGGEQNNCGIKPDPCISIFCNEDADSCSTTPANDGAACTPKNLCQVNGVCVVGDCIGEPKSCAFSPLAECNLVTCNPATGKCEGEPDSTKDNRPCVLSGDICHDKKICQAGQCVGGVLKDCSGLNMGCEIGVCNSATGQCVSADAPVGTVCTPGTSDCEIGSCNDKGACVAAAAPNGTACNDYDACTKSSICSNGVCGGGSAVASCSTYLDSSFESCPGGWTLNGDWQCGVPDNVGPLNAHIGTGVLATQVAGLYHVNQTYAMTTANSPAIDLTMATNPMVSFWAWDHTEGGIFDGWNLKISVDGGQSFAQVANVTPPYNLTIAGQPAWGGDNSVAGWRNFMADLTAYAGKNAILQFAFRSDGATVYPGVYVDDVIVAEPLQIPMYITTGSALQDIYSGMDYSQPLAKLGGTANSVWSIVPGGQNAAWLTIDPMTGTLLGTPSPADVGQVKVTVHVEEPTLPSNYAEKTFSFHVKANTYYTSFEGMCPAGWTLTGDWECGKPTMVGPTAAYIGNQCVATKIASFYSNQQTWAATTATSPDIDLTNASNPVLTWRMWYDTEGSTYDGVNLKVSTDGGMTYTLVNAVAPMYTLTVAGQPCWGGHQGANGWQFMQADLSPYIGQVIKLQFGFQSDTSGTFPGVYIDDFFIN